MADIIQIRRDIAANWTSADPTLSQGEWGWETDTNKLKLGDGSTAWTSLSYLFFPGMNETFKVSADDTTEDFAVAKILGSSSILATETNGGGNETLVFTAIPGGINHDSLFNAVGTNSHATIDSHIASTANPHSVTKAQVGLGSVENTALSTWAGTTSLTTLGTITTGVWTGTALGANYVPNHDDLNGFVAGEHFTEGSISHLNITNIGSNSHAVIDTHIASTANPHSVTLAQAGASTFTAGSVPFSNGSTFTEDNANLFYDDVTNRLGIGTNSPDSTLDVAGVFTVTQDATNDITLNVSSGRAEFRSTGAMDFIPASGKQILFKPSGINTGIQFSNSQQISAALFKNENAVSALNENRLAFNLNTTSTSRQAGTMTLRFTTTADATRTSRYDFTTVDGGSAQTPLSLKGANVGIQTTSPTEALDVNGRIVEEGTFAEIHVHDASASQSIATGATYTKCTLFVDNGESSNCTADVSNDKITITKTGRYLVTGSFSFTSGTANVVWKGAPFLNGVEQDKIHWERKASTSTDVGATSFSGVIDVTTASWDLDFRVAHDSGGSVNFTMSYGNLSVLYLGET